MTADGIRVNIKQLFESLTDDGRKQSSVQQTSFPFVGVEEHCLLASVMSLFLMHSLTDVSYTLLPGYLTHKETPEFGTSTGPIVWHSSLYLSINVIGSFYVL